MGVKDREPVTTQAHLMTQAPDRNASGISELVERAVRGDTVATGALLKALAPTMIRSAQQLLGSAHPDLDDVVQLALIGLVQALPRFRNECSAAHFACRIVARTAVAARRRQGVRADRQDDAVDVDAVARPAEAGVDGVDAERRRELVRGLLATLPEEQAETLALRVVLGFSLDEVAEATGVPMNTVRSRVRLAKTALRRRIEAQPGLLEALEVES
jgi:RNA polymerase sigma-70 factor (ECF subfamily)